MRRGGLEGRGFFAEDGTDEIVGTGIDGKRAVFGFGCYGVGGAFELLVETRHDRVEEGLFLRLEGRFGFEGIDELLREVRSIAESGHVRPFAEIDGVSFVVAGTRFVGLETSLFGDVSVIIIKVFSALDHAAFFVCADHFFDIVVVFNFSHMSIKYIKIYKGVSAGDARGREGGVEGGIEGGRVAKQGRPITAHLPRTYDALITHLSRTNFSGSTRWYYILCI